MSRREVGWAWVLGLVALTACRARPDGIEPETPLERAVHYTEIDRDEVRYPLSAKPPKEDAQDEDGEDGPLVVERVPVARAVDVNSVLHVRLLKDELARGELTEEERARHDVLVARASRLAGVLEGLADLTRARTAAIEAWAGLQVESTDATQAAFSEAKRALGKAESEATDALLEAFPEDEETVGELYEAYVLGEPGLAAFLQRRVDELERDNRRRLDEALRDSARLKIEAFLLPDGKDEPTPIHVPHYDRLQAREVSTIDRWSRTLSPEEEAAFAERLAVVREVARAAEEVRAEQATASEAFGALETELGRALAAYVDRILALESALDDASLRDRADATITAFDLLLAALEELAQGQVGEGLNAFESTARAQLDVLAQEVDTLGDLAVLVDEVPELIEAWQDPFDAELLDLIDDSVAAKRKIGSVLKNTDDLIEAFEALLLAVDNEADVLVEAGLEDAETLWEESALRAELDRWRDLAGQVKEIAAPVARLLDVGGLGPKAPVDLRTPDALELPLDDAPNTRIDLKTAPRKPGDSVEVRATLLAGDRLPRTASATFELAKLGWHADPVPSVVLTTADKSSAASDSGGFAPAVNYMLAYTPRLDDDSALAASARLLGWGVGVHATFLNFDPDNDAEIGLGVTLGLWGDLVQLGTGINVLADSDDDGRLYYFVGSSLIPVLQALTPGE